MSQTYQPAPDTITAALAGRYGPPDVVRLAEIPCPPVGNNDVLIRVHFSTVSSGDARIRAARAPRGFGLIIRLIFGLTGPRRPVLGTELSGIVAAVGPHVTAFRAGDAVFAFPGGRMGAHATHVVMPADGRIMKVPAGVGLDAAAALSFGGTTALGFLRDKARVGAGEQVLVIGASGAVGSAAVQIARSMGADVTGVCSARNADLVLSLGAMRVIDYRTQDVTTLPDRYDVIVDTTGMAAFATHRHLLTAKGRLALVAADLPQMLGALRGGKRVLMGPGPETLEALQTLAALAESGAFRPVIGQRFVFADIAAAHALVDGGHKRGSVLIAFDPAGCYPVLPFSTA